MPLRKTDDGDDHNNGGKAAGENAMGEKFPPEAFAYDSNITEAVVKRVQAEADKVLSQEEWIVVDGVRER